MRVVIDSNVICKDFLLTGAISRVFFGGLDLTGHSLCVPQLVIDEVINKYSEKLTICQTKIGERIRDIEDLTAQNLFSPVSNDRKDKMIRKYRELLKNRMSKAGATILKYPTVSHRRGCSPVAIAEETSCKRERRIPRLPHLDNNN